MKDCHERVSPERGIFEISRDTSMLAPNLYTLLSQIFWEVLLSQFCLLQIEKLDTLIMSRDM